MPLESKEHKKIISSLNPKLLSITFVLLPLLPFSVPISDHYITCPGNISHGRQGTINSILAQTNVRFQRYNYISL